MMVRRISRQTRLLTALVLSAVLVAGLLGPGTVSAQAATHRPTIAQVLRHLKGTVIINSRLRVRTTVIGYDKTTEHKWGTFYTPRLQTQQICVRGRPCANATIYRFDMTPSGPVKVMAVAPNGHQTRVYMAGESRPAGVRANTVVQPMSSHWWNPFSWPWSDVWHWVYEHVVRRCATGVAAATFSLGTTNLAAKFLLRGGIIRAAAASAAHAGPEAMAVGAVAGCLFNITNQFLNS